MSVVLAIGLVLALQSAGAAPPPGDAAPDALEEPERAEVRLVSSVRRIARQLATLGIADLEREPTAIRAPSEAHRIASEIRTARAISGRRLAARGRAWSDIGLGAEGSPRALYLALAEDLDGLCFDPTGSRLLVGPERLTEKDFDADDVEVARAALLMATGLRPDEPAIAHVLTHWSRWERSGRPEMPDTTDALLARFAWEEGEANLVALRLLFGSMGIDDTVLERGYDPGDALGGGLVPRGLRDSDRVEARLLNWVYRDSFPGALAAYRAGGRVALDEAMTTRLTTRDVVHPDRKPLPTPDLPLPGADAPDGLGLVDRDSLGEQALAVLVATGSGKDNLGALAADGWAGDALYRWEDDDGSGVTMLQTRWVSPEEAADFEYGYRRALEVRFPDATWEDEGEGRSRLSTPQRVFGIVRVGRDLLVRVGPPHLAPPQPERPSPGRQPR